MTGDGSKSDVDPVGERVDGLAVTLRLDARRVVRPRMSHHEHRRRVEAFDQEPRFLVDRQAERAADAPHSLLAKPLLRGRRRARAKVSCAILRIEHPEESRGVGVALEVQRVDLRADPADGLAARARRSTPANGRAGSTDYASATGAGAARAMSGAIQAGSDSKILQRHADEPVERRVAVDGGDAERRRSWVKLAAEEVVDCWRGERARRMVASGDQKQTRIGPRRHRMRLPPCSASRGRLPHRRRNAVGEPAEPPASRRYTQHYPTGKRPPGPAFLTRRLQLRSTLVRQPAKLTV